MRYFSNKKIIGCIVLAIVFGGVSIFLYGNYKDKVFKDEYMKEIFVEEETEAKEEVLVNSNDTTANKNFIVVEIKGEVLKPDVYFLDEGSIIKDLIDMAGGLTEEGDISRINRADVLKNHQLIFIPNKNQVQDEVDSGVEFFGEISEDKSSLININTAKLDELKQINGIGDTKAQSIINYREANGGFKSIEDIKNVDGIGEKTFEKLKDQITY